MCGWVALGGVGGRILWSPRKPAFTLTYSLEQAASAGESGKVEIGKIGLRMFILAQKAQQELRSLQRMLPACILATTSGAQAINMANTNIRPVTFQRFVAVFFLYAFSGVQQADKRSGGGSSSSRAKRHPRTEWVVVCHLAVLVVGSVFEGVGLANGQRIQLTLNPNPRSMSYCVCVRDSCVCLASGPCLCVSGTLVR